MKCNFICLMTVFHSQICDTQSRRQYFEIQSQFNPQKLGTKHLKLKKNSEKLKRLIRVNRTLGGHF